MNEVILIEVNEVILIVLVIFNWIFGIFIGYKIGRINAYKQILIKIEKYPKKDKQE